MAYNQGDRIYVTFNQAVNRAGQSREHVTRPEIDAVFEFSHALGAQSQESHSCSHCLRTRPLADGVQLPVAGSTSE